MVCYAKRFMPGDYDGGRLPRGEREEPRQTVFLKRFTVFDVDPSEGWGPASSQCEAFYTPIIRCAVSCHQGLSQATTTSVATGM